MTEQQEKALRVLAGGGSQAEAAAAAGVSTRSVRRWTSTVFADQLSAASTEVAVRSGIDVRLEATVAKLEEIEGLARSVLAEARASGDMKSLAGLIREIRGAVTDVARLRGQLRDTQVNVAVGFVESQEWRSLVSRMMNALAPYPEARAALRAEIERGGE